MAMLWERDECQFYRALIRYVCSVACLTIVALGLATRMQRVSADPPPAFQATVTPATAESGPVVKLSGRFGSEYTGYDVADNTVFDRRRHAVGSAIGASVVNCVLRWRATAAPANLTILGGVVDGRIPLD